MGTLRRSAWIGFIFPLIPGMLFAAEQPAVSVSICDTVAASSGPLAPSAMTAKAGWTKLPEENISHRFQGDAVLSNGRLTVVFRQHAPGAELYADGTAGPALRAVLAPLGEKGAVRLISAAIVENSAAEAAIDASFATPDGKQATVRFELQAGQVFVRTQVRGGTQRLRLEAPCRFAVLPDFFADDIAVDATELPSAKAELPSENFLLHMVGGGDAIVLAVWNQREEDVQVTLAGEGQARMFQASEIPYGNQGSVDVAVLECPAIWHWSEVRKADIDYIIDLRWKQPFAAQWRMDWRQDDGLTDSWEMLAQQPDGTYAKADWFGQSDSFGTPDWLKRDRRRWTTVLGGFLYPCWIAKDGEGFIQPLKRPGRFQGPAIVYPINRLPTTPLTAFTFVDVMRATLGVGPCEYVLDVEGQQKQSAGVPTCATRAKLDDIYTNKEQKQRQAEVEQALDNVLAFVRHIRTRIEAYAGFGREMVAYLDQQKKAQPDLAGFLSETATVAGRIEAAVANRKQAIRTPEYATQLVDEFRTTLVGYEGGDALEKCKKITAGLVQIGGNQDELVGECRVAVRILRQKAALAMAVDPRTAAVAKEIRRRTQTMLRNPTSYEAPRH